MIRSQKIDVHQGDVGKVELILLFCIWNEKETSPFWQLTNYKLQSHKSFQADVCTNHFPRGTITKDTSKISLYS